MNATLQRTKQFIYRNARPLDLARWQFHFEGGEKENVLHALSYYQNDDGGFAHALEPDAWNPYSSPIQTWTATEILREINFVDTEHIMIQNILRYLESGQHFDGSRWFNCIPSNNDFPHAPWWHVSEELEFETNNNPTACLAGFIIRFAEPDSAVHNLGMRVAQQAMTDCLEHVEIEDVHLIAVYIRLMEYIEEAGQTNLFTDFTAFKNKLKTEVKRSISPNTSEWETSYVCKPSQFIQSRDSIFYHDNQALADYECEHIIRTQQADGAWVIPWDWGSFPEEWAISKNWWKAHSIINNLLYLNEVGGN